jgi:hypothetical protein
MATTVGANYSAPEACATPRASAAASCQGVAFPSRFSALPVSLLSFAIQAQAPLTVDARTGSKLRARVVQTDRPGHSFSVAGHGPSAIRRQHL